ncbi:MAG TPA: BON domain-containing protein [Kofleriaceae bacterium]
MANHQNGGRNASADEHRPSWRPQDQSTSSSHRPRTNEDDHDYSSWRERNEPVERDPRRWEGSRGSEVGAAEGRDRSSTEYYGQGQSGYSAGRYGEDRSQQHNMQNRNEMWSPAPGSSEDRRYETGTDDRWTGRGGNNWADRGDHGYNPERSGSQGGYQNELGGQGGRAGRGYDQRNQSQQGNYGQRGNQGQRDPGQRFDQHGGYDRPSYGNANVSGDRMARMNDMGPYDQRMGSQGQGHDSEQHSSYNGPAYVGPHQPADWSPSQRGSNDEAGQRHVHRGSGPHRGKGPQGYQRSDERIREMVCEALADDDQIDASQIQVAVKDGEVTLTGTVDNRRIRREAEDCVSAVSGVRDVQVQLRVRGEQGQQGQQQGASNATSSSTSSTTSGTIGHGAPGKIETEVASGSAAGAQDKKHRA